LQPRVSATTAAAMLFRIRQLGFIAGVTRLGSMIVMHAPENYE